MVDGKVNVSEVVVKQEEKKIDETEALKTELSASKEEVKKLSRELETVKKKVSRPDLDGLSDFLRSLLKESNDVKKREQLLSWIKRL